MERFFTLRETAFRNPKSYFRKYGDLTDVEATTTATSIWKSIDGKTWWRTSSQLGHEPI